MNWKKEEIDFRNVLQIEEERELDFLPSRLKDVVSLAGFRDVPFLERFNEVFDIYSRYEIAGLDFLSLAQHFDDLYPHEMERPDKMDEIKIGNVTLYTSSSQEKPGEDKIRTMSGFHGLGTEEAGMAHYEFLGRKSTQEALKWLMLQVWMLGSVRVPFAWTKNNTVTVATNGFWAVSIRNELAIYDGQDNNVYEALTALVRYLASKKETMDIAAFHIYDEAMFAYKKKAYASVYDCLKLLINFPVQHERTVTTAGELIGSPSAAVRSAVALLLNHSPSPQLCEVIVEQCICEECEPVAEELIRALRQTGGERAFQGLLKVARDADLEHTRERACRALPWVCNYPDDDKALHKLCVSRDRKISDIGFTALKERKYHGVMAREGQLASNEEAMLYKMMKNWVQYEDNEARDVLTSAFSRGKLKVEVLRNYDNVIKQIIIRMDTGIPLYSEEKRNKAFAAILNRLNPEQELIPGASLSDEALRLEMLKHRIDNSIIANDSKKVFSLFFEICNGYLADMMWKELADFCLEMEPVVKQSGDAQLQAYAQSFLGTAKAALGDTAAGLENMQQGMSMANEAGLLQTEAEIRLNFGITLYESGDHSSGVENVKKSVAVLREIKSPVLQKAEKLLLDMTG